MPTLSLSSRSLLILVLLTVSQSLVGEQTVSDSALAVKKAAPAVVLIKGTGAEGNITGTGFLIASDGKVVTCLHIVQGLKAGAVKLANREVYSPFSIRAFDEQRDLAIIQISGFNLPTVELGDSNELQAGEAVLLVGSPLGLEQSVTSGVVSAIRESPEMGKIIQTDAAANPGNSGGPLLNARGQAVGVLDFKLRGTENLNFAIPINYARGMLNNLSPPMTFDELRGKLGASAAVLRPTGFPTRWKSLTSGTVRVLRVEGDHVYVETILSEQARQMGGFSLADLKKDGERYVGSIRYRLVGRLITWGGLGYCDSKCVFERSIEILSFTPSRIEGRIMAPADNSKLNCGKCRYSKEFAWQAFVWIPE